MNDMSRPAAPLTRAREATPGFGPVITADGVGFRLWAPYCESVALRLEGRPADLPMRRAADGWFDLEVEDAGPGTRYSFVLSNGQVVPDPASRYQPQDVHGPSEVVDPEAYRWSDSDWRGRPWEEAIIYELHIGAFTETGTFRAAIDRLDHLVELGVTAIELMPVNDFPGRWNWGYDGVLLFAVESSYGRPEDLKALVDAAHARGLMVFLDVVYNHFGPVGNYMPLYAPLLTEKHATPWGAAVNYDDEGSRHVREMVIASVRYWLREYHVDGFRFDAVHEIRDASSEHILETIAAEARRAAGDRQIHLVLENAANEGHWLSQPDTARPVRFDGTWSDDIHHALHCAVTGERFWYYSDFAGRPELLGRALAEGFAFQGDFSAHAGEARGEPSAHLPPNAFVSFIQNHDQVGNRPIGDRIHKIAPADAVRAAAVINLLSPHTPLLFMGEEWASASPFPFFSDVDADLVDAIREGRASEFGRLQDAIAPDAELPDPMAEATFRAAKLDWNALQHPEPAAWLRYYRAVIAVRRAEIVPRLRGMAGGAGSYELLAEDAMRLRWRLGDGSELIMLCNLTPDPVAGIDPTAGRQIWREGMVDGDRMEPWTIVVSIVEGGAGNT